MSQTLPNLGLPVMQPSQAQRHVTNNEELNVLDTVTQLCVLDSTLMTPPLAQRGDRYLVPNEGVDAWENHVGALALYDGNVWLFVTAQVGWRSINHVACICISTVGVGLSCLSTLNWRTFKMSE